MMRIILPLYVDIPRKRKADKRFLLNLNVYRNTHYQTLNDAKIEMKNQVRLAMLKCLDPMPKPPYSFSYSIFPGSARGFDLGNVCSIIQKFTDDALINLGYITDDNYNVVREVNYRFGGKDKDNPRAELEIRGL